MSYVMLGLLAPSSVPEEFLWHGRFQRRIEVKQRHGSIATIRGIA